MSRALPLVANGSGLPIRIGPPIDLLAVVRNGAVLGGAAICVNIELKLL
jgi:hypothetical protein